MSLLYAVLLLGVSAVLIRALYIIGRLPRTPWWAREGIAHVAVVAVTGVIACGLIFLLDFLFNFNDEAFGLKALLGTAGIVALGVVVWKLMDRWSAAQPGLSVVPPSISTGDGPSTIPPEQPRKAA